jgi:hypothetical protein
VLHNQKNVITTEAIKKLIIKVQEAYKRLCLVPLPSKDVNVIQLPLKDVLKKDILFIGVATWRKFNITGSPKK